MRKLIHIAWNDIKIEFSSPSTLVFFLVLPVLFTIILGIALSNMGGSDDPETDTRFPVLVVNKDQSPMASDLLQALDESTVIRPVIREATEAEQIFADQDVQALLTIPIGFEENLLNGEEVDLPLRLDSSNNRYFAIQEALRASISRLGSAVAIAHASQSRAEELGLEMTEEQRQAYFSASLNLAHGLLADPPTSVRSTQAEEITIEIPTGFDQSSAGQLVTWTMITLVGAAEIFVAERLGGTLRRLLVTPTHKATLLTGKILGRFSMGMFQMILLIGFGVLFFGVNWGRSPLALALIVVTFGLAAVALGVMLGALVRTPAQASGLTILFSMLLSALGGAWWPLEVTPPAYQQAVQVLPTTWAMKGFNDVIIRGQSAVEVLPEAGILLFFAAVFFTIGVWRLRYE